MKEGEVIQDNETPDPVRPLRSEDSDYDPLIEQAELTRFVLLGEASHGTHEFYRERAEITKRLITEGAYTAVAVEADWPDAYRVNCYVRGASDDGSADVALSDFRRFPVWMWRNTVVLEFVEWLRAHNDALPAKAPKVGFYGLDLYSMHRSMEAVVEYLQSVDPEAARRARERYSCFDHYGTDPQVYGYAAGPGGEEPCERGAVEVLIELRERVAKAADQDDRVDVDRMFYAERNAQLVVDAERYYRAAFRGGQESWNLRDRHMAETLEALAGHLERRQGATRIAVWEHNSHLGDARATEMGEAGQLNVGQLVRAAHGDDALLVGFTTRSGTVTAASDWGGPARRKRVRRALEGSWEDYLHGLGHARLLLDTAAVSGRRLERAIGVIYRPETERPSHYFHARLADQFDAVLHFDMTRAVEPLEIDSVWEAGELPETFPSGV